MNNPLISVLIPCYNREKYIEQCVSAVTSQSYKHLEIIICDNASTDTTYSILQKLAAEDIRIKVMQNQTNLGPIPNWKKCLQAATGQYIHWMWSDDYIEPEFYQNMVCTLQSTNASVVLAKHKVFIENTNQMLEGYCYIDFDILPGNKVMHEMLLRRSAWAVSPAAWLLPATCVKKYFYDQIPVFGIYNCNRTAIGADLLMIAGCCKDSESVAFCKDACVVFRAHPNSISMSRPMGHHYELAKLWFIISHKQYCNLRYRYQLLKRAKRVKFFVCFCIVYLYVVMNHSIRRLLMYLRRRRLTMLNPGL